jgi:hypothetical protein
MSDLLRQYEPWSFGSGGITKKVYSRGRGPNVVIMHEVFGLDEPALQLGIDLSDQFRVHLPLLFGEPGASSKTAWIGACIRREIFVFATRRTSPIVDWLRALCRKVRNDSGHEGVGVIGMCLTGGFALTLVADESVLAPVVAQASIPPWPRSALGMSPQDANEVAKRTRELGHHCVLALRYEGDCIAPYGKIESMRDMIGSDALHYVRLDGSEHSTLTLSRDATAFRETREFLARRLGVAGAG